MGWVCRLDQPQSVGISIYMIWNLASKINYLVNRSIKVDLWLLLATLFL